MAAVHINTSSLVRLQFALIQLVSVRVLYLGNPYE